jgi:hypothetical protein
MSISDREALSPVPTQSPPHLPQGESDAGRRRPEDSEDPWNVIAQLRKEIDSLKAEKTVLDEKVKYVIDQSAYYRYDKKDVNAAMAEEVAALREEIQTLRNALDEEKLDLVNSLNKERKDKAKIAKDKVQAVVDNIHLQANLMDAKQTIQELQSRITDDA